MFVVLIQNLEEIPSEFSWKILHGTFFQIVDRMDRVHRVCSNATFRIVLASSRLILIIRGPVIFNYPSE